MHTCINEYIYIQIYFFKGTQNKRNPQMRYHNQLLVQPLLHTHFKFYLIGWPQGSTTHMKNINIKTNMKYCSTTQHYVKHTLVHTSLPRHRCQNFNEALRSQTVSARAESTSVQDRNGYGQAEVASANDQLGQLVCATANVGDALKQFINHQEKSMATMACNGQFSYPHQANWNSRWPTMTNNGGQQQPVQLSSRRGLLEQVASLR